MNSIRVTDSRRNRQALPYNWLVFAFAGLAMPSTGICQDKSPDQTAESAVNGLDWIAGKWISEDPNGQVTEECWLEPSDGLMVGCSRILVSGESPFFEFLRIQVVGNEVHYIAQPKGNLPSSFPMKLQSKDEVVFENLTHDFPQRITYRKTSDGKLHAAIDGVIEGTPRSQEWVFRKS